MISAMPMSICSVDTWCVELPSPERMLEVPTRPIPTCVHVPASYKVACAAYLGMRSAIGCVCWGVWGGGHLRAEPHASAAMHGAPACITALVHKPGCVQVRQRCCMRPAAMHKPHCHACDHSHHHAFGHALTTQHTMPMRWKKFSLRPRNRIANDAANSISAPRII